MVDMSAIAGAISSLNTAVNIAKTMKDLHDSTVVQSKVIELQSTILDAQGSLFAANEERASLIERIRQHEQKIADLEAWNTEKQRYQLTDIGDGTFAYTLKAAMSDGEPAHYICTNCYEQSKKSVLHHMRSSSGLNVVSCPRCNAKMGVSHYRSPSYVQSEEDKVRASLEPCLICNSGRLKVTNVAAHPTMGDVGLQEITLKCDNKACSHTQKRMHDPMGRTKSR